MDIVKDFISFEDVFIVQKYIDTIKFHTKEDHDPLHDQLFSGGIEFDIHTRGEMPKKILEIFSKYSKGFYEIIKSKTNDEYHPPMFSKHYIAGYGIGKKSDLHHNKNNKPEGTYGSYIIWKNAEVGGNILFPNLNLSFISNPGDLIFFEETEENLRGISEIIKGSLYISEAWMGKKGQHWMPNRTSYEETDWEDWQIKGFYE